MNKILQILQREYLNRVMRPAFLITTLLVPIVIAGFYAAIAAIATDSSNSQTKIAVMDPANRLKGQLIQPGSGLDVTYIQSTNESDFVKRYDSLGYELFLYVPPAIFDDARQPAIIHTQKTPAFASVKSIQTILNNQYREHTFQLLGIDSTKRKQLSAEIPVITMTDKEAGSKKTNADVAYGLSYVCGFLIYILMLTYGTQVMRGVSEEKVNRIAEVMISSVKPFQLMMGKIIGIGAVGITQFSIWLLILFSLYKGLPAVLPAQYLVGFTSLFEGLSGVPIASIIGWFLFYFLGGYLTYAALFATIGSIVSEDQQEAQSLVFPVMMPIILGFVLMTKAIEDPNSSLAVFGSLFPLTSPMVMMGRITYDVPTWQLAVSALLLIGCFVLLTWLTGKIYRTAILLYGKRPSFSEIMKWAFQK
jgi:ABC-2 type transport system permease protein